MVKGLKASIHHSETKQGLNNESSLSNIDTSMQASSKKKGAAAARSQRKQSDTVPPAKGPARNGKSCFLSLLKWPATGRGHSDGAQIGADLRATSKSSCQECNS